MDWWCRPTWRRAGVNTSWCLLGCSIGEFGTIAALQYAGVGSDGVTALTMVLPVVNGLATSVALETAVLMYGPSQITPVRKAFETAMGMSFASMVAMELAMEAADFAMTGGMVLTAPAVPVMLLCGFLAPLPYNYYRLKKHGKACH